MSDFETVRGFEDVWRPPVTPRPRRPQAVLTRSSAAGGEVRARLARLAARTPEVMVKVMGRTRDPGHLQAHLDYISRNGELELEDRDGALLSGRGAVRDLTEDWWARAAADPRRRATSPLSHSIVLSMPAATDPIALRDAARAFAADVFASEHDYVFTLHTDAAHPHVHLCVCSRGDTGRRLNPKKADLEAWRQAFAQALRDRGVPAEATPRRARGVTRKAERLPLRKLRERHDAGLGAPARVRRAAYQEAARAAFLGETAPTAWEQRALARQNRIRSLYLAQAHRLLGSRNPEDRQLGDDVQTFVRGMPAPDSQRLALARALRARSPGRDGDGGPDKDRSR